MTKHSKKVAGKKWQAFPLGRTKAVLALLGAAVMCASPVKADPPGGTAGWTLSFEDNFNGTALDTSKWTASSAQDGTVYQYHLPSSNKVANGILTQETTRRDSTTFWNSYIDTANKFEPVYAYFEARSKTSWATAAWPSFWTVARFGWPPELDIYENWGGPNVSMTSQNWHFRNSSGAEEGDQNGYWLPTSHPNYWNSGWGADYHTYAALWEEGKITWYVDGVLVHTSTKEVTTLPMYMILSNGIGRHNNFDFSDGPGDKYNQKVDYVRVWTKPLGNKLSRSGWSASASSSGAYWPASNAIDGDVNSRWASGANQVNGQWFQVNLGASQTFDKAVLRVWASTTDAPSAVSVYVSDDGVNWGNAIASKSDTANIQDLNTAIFSFPSQTKRYIRFVQTGSKNYWWSIEDMDLYSSGSTSSNGSNLITNPGFESQQFETQTPTGWSEVSYTGGVDASYTQHNNTNGGRGGNYHLAHWRNSAYKIATYQTKSGLANGLYTFRAWARKVGNGTCQLYAKNFGGSQITANVPASSSYQQVTISNINVTNGQIEIGLWSDQASSSSWAIFDDVEFFKQ
jgi:beta-glucanase (GH16 family)